VKYLVKLGPVAMPGRIAQDGEIIELEPADGDTLVRYGILALVEEPEPESTPEPDQLEPASDPSPEDKPVRAGRRKSAPEPEEQLEV
jgi:hypothetical protein